MNRLGAGPQSDEASVLRVQAVARSMMYLPLVLASQGGLFADQGLRVETSIPGPGPGAANAVLGGSADVALGGIWRAAMYVALGKKLMAFTAIARRCPMFLLARRGIASRGWNGLEGSTLVLCNDAPSGWVPLESRIKAHGVDLNRVRLMPDLSPAEGVALFRAGYGDYIYLVQPGTEELLEQGEADILASMAEEIGPLPWSVFMATPNLLAQHRQRVERFVSGIQAALTRIAQSSPREILSVVKTYYEDMPPSRFVGIVSRYKALNAWPEGPAIEPSWVQSWEKLLVASGMLRGPFDWTSVVDSSFAKPVE